MADVAGITIQTVSSHLAKLADANLLSTEKQGRHRYYRLANADVALVLEALMDLAQRTGFKRVRTGPKDAALRQARVCYDHLAGEYGVALLRSVIRKDLIDSGNEMTVTEKGRRFFEDFGLDVAQLERGRRPLCLHCLDWSERHHHLGGALGAALLEAMLDRGWIRRGEGRVLIFTPKGKTEFDSAFRS